MKQTITLKATFTSHAQSIKLSKVYNIDNQKLVAIVTMNHDGPPTDCMNNVNMSRAVETGCDNPLPVLVWVINDCPNVQLNPSNIHSMNVQGVVQSEAQITSLQGTNKKLLEILPAADAKLFANRAEADPGNKIAATIAKFNELNRKNM